MSNGITEPLLGSPTRVLNGPHGVDVEPRASREDTHARQLPDGILPTFFFFEKLRNGVVSYGFSIFHVYSLHINMYGYHASSHLGCRFSWPAARRYFGQQLRLPGAPVEIHMGE
jgi:hypothetical protein